MNVFDYVNAINSSTKRNLMRGTDDDKQAEAEYVPFIVNKSLSYFPDTVLLANEMNVHHALDNRLQNDFLLNSVRPAKRFAKWVKREDINDIEIVKQFYGYSTEKAQQAMTILTAENLHYIKQKLERGGNNDKARDVSRGKTEDR